MMIRKTDFIFQTQLAEETLEVWLAEEWLLPEEDQQDFIFTEADIARARLISSLINDFGVNNEGVGIILSLIDQMHSLRKAVAGKLEQGPK